jgi:isocitrate dehydrogenase (NAD+)
MLTRIYLNGRMMKKKITLIPGDGIGPEITLAATRILEAAGAEIEWETIPAGLNALSEYGQPVPEELLDSIRRNKVALKGPITTVVGKGFASANVTLRKQLGLYANLRPVRSIKGIETRYKNINLVIVRENTEDLYSGIEHLIAPGVTESIKVITLLASTRIAKFAFEFARKYGRKSVHAVHKANIMKLTDGMFLDATKEVAKNYPDITYKEIIVDNCAMQMVMNPNQFEVLVLTNLYGDIISDLCAGLVGGLGVVPGANIGDDFAVFEAVHGSAPDIAGKNLANPLAIIFSSISMLRYLGWDEIAGRINSTVSSILEKGEIKTRDLGGTATTTQFTEAILSELPVKTAV